MIGFFFYITLRAFDVGVWRFLSTLLRRHAGCTILLIFEASQCSLLGINDFLAARSSAAKFAAASILLAIFPPDSLRLTPL